MTLDDLRALVATAEFHKLVKVEVADADPSGKVTLQLPYDPAYTIYARAGNYHGGVIACLIDIAGAMSCTMVTGRPTPTANMRVDFMKSPAKCDLYACGEARRIGRQFGVADVTVRDEDGTVFAMGRGTFVTADPAAAKPVSDQVKTA